MSSTRYDDLPERTYATVAALETTIDGAFTRAEDRSMGKIGK
jgi:hypothetical protein